MEESRMRDVLAWIQDAILPRNDPLKGNNLDDRVKEGAWIYPWSTFDNAIEQRFGDLDMDDLFAAIPDQMGEERADNDRIALLSSVNEPWEETTELNNLSTDTRCAIEGLDDTDDLTEAVGDAMDICDDDAGLDNSGGLGNNTTGQHGVETCDDQVEQPPKTPDDASKLSKARYIVQVGSARADTSKRHDTDLKATPEALRTGKTPIQLWPHQLAAVGWMIQILEEFGGVLLAYQMGLGKTFIVISLLLTVGILTQKKGPVLIVMPRALLGQWADDLSAINPPPKVCIYYKGRLGNQFSHASHTVDELESFDVVLTTYTIMRNQYLDQQGANTAWTKWFTKKLPFNRPIRGRFPLFAITWWYIVLDEAHLVSNPTTHLSIAAAGLSASFRIAVTGTALQNDYTDIQGLLRFLQLSPWSDLSFFKKFFIQRKSKHRADMDTKLKAVLAATVRAVSLRLRITDKFDGLTVGTFKPGEEIPIKHELSETQQQFQELIEHLYDPEAKAALEGAKRNGQAGSLPRESVFRTIIEARLAIAHDACATASYGEIGDEDLVNGPDGPSEEDIEAKLFRYLDGEGQENHGGKRKATQQEAQQRRKDFMEARRSDWHTSPRMQVMLSIVSARLGTRPATTTINTPYGKDGSPPLHTMNGGISSMISDVDVCPSQEFLSRVFERAKAKPASAKANHGKEKSPDPTRTASAEHPSKIIIFSEFLSPLDVAEVVLEIHGYRCARYDGWVTAQDREDALKSFKADDKCEVLLMTSRCGGVGLNLPSASTVIHLTPCWNPALCDQCNGRVVRPGQKKDVKVFYLIAEDSIEMHVAQLAAGKRLKASNIMDPQLETVELYKEIALWNATDFNHLMEVAANSAKKHRQQQERKSKKLREKKSREFWRDYKTSEGFSGGEEAQSDEQSDSDVIYGSDDD